LGTGSLIPSDDLEPPGRKVCFTPTADIRSLIEEGDTVGTSLDQLQEWDACIG
jgi:hypothetical protein